MFDESGLINKLITAAVVGLLGWNVVSTQKLTVQSAVQNESLSNIKETLAITSLDRYTASQAKADFSLLEQRIKRLEDWNSNQSENIRLLTDRLNKLTKQ